MYIQIFIGDFLEASDIRGELIYKFFVTVKGLVSVLPERIMNCMPITNFRTHK